jgi:hypothetical protein
MRGRRVLCFFGLTGFCLSAAVFYYVYRPVSKPFLTSAVAGLTVIHLWERTDRWSDFYQTWLIPPAVLPVPTFVTTGVRDSPAFQGCTRAHMKALQEGWRRFKHQPQAFLLVLEDDATTESEPLQRWLLPPWPTDAQVIQLACNPLRLERCRHTSPYYRVHASLCLTALCIRISYIPQLYHHYHTAYTQETPVDLYLQHIQYKDHWYAHWPPLMYQKPSYSDLEKRPVDYGLWDRQGLQATWL